MASISADRYQRALAELEFAMSSTGQQVAWLKAQTRDYNKATVEQMKQLDMAATSYDKIKAEIKELTQLYKSLSAAERADASFGQEVISELQAKNAELKKLENAIKPVVEQMTRLQKAEQEKSMPVCFPKKLWKSPVSTILMKRKRRKTN